MCRLKLMDIKMEFLDGTVWDDCIVDMDGEDTCPTDKDRLINLKYRVEEIERVLQMQQGQELAAVPDDLRQRVENIEQQMEMQIKVSAENEHMGTTDGKTKSVGTKRREIVSSEELETYIDEAVKLGQSNMFGCSKLFIHRYLEEKHGIKDRRYMKKRINDCLKDKFKIGAYKMKGNFITIVD